MDRCPHCGSVNTIHRFYRLNRITAVECDSCGYAWSVHHDDFQRRAPEQYVLFCPELCSLDRGYIMETVESFRRRMKDANSQLPENR